MHFYQKEISVVGTNLEPARQHQTVGPKVNISAVGPSSFCKGQDSDLVLNLHCLKISTPGVNPPPPMWRPHATLLRAARVWVQPVAFYHMSSPAFLTLLHCIYQNKAEKTLCNSFYENFSINGYKPLEYTVFTSVLIKSAHISGNALICMRFIWICKSALTCCRSSPP